MIKSKTMAVRDSEIPYVDSNNDLQGSVPSLAFFVCEHGVTGSGTTAYVEDAVNKLRVATGSGTQVTNNRIDTDATNAFNLLADSTGATTGAALTAINTALQLTATQDILMVVAGLPETNGTDEYLNFTFRDNGGSSIVAVRGRTGASPNAPSITDNSGNTATETFTALTSATDNVICHISDRTANRLNGYRNEGKNDAAYQGGGNVDISLVTDTLAFGSAPQAQLRGHIAGAAFFRLPAGTINSNPSHFRALADWMGAQWLAGNYVIHPELSKY